MSLRRRLGHGFFAKLVGQIQLAFGLSGRFSDLITDELNGFGFAGWVEELFDRDVDFADVFVAESALAAELEGQSEAVLLSGGFVDGELHWEVPGGVRAAVSVDGGFLLGTRVAVDRNDDVDVHLGDKVDVLEVFCRDDIDLQCPVLHIRVLQNLERKEIARSLEREKERICGMSNHELGSRMQNEVCFVNACTPLKFNPSDGLIALKSSDHGY